MGFLMEKHIQKAKGSIQDKADREQRDLQDVAAEAEVIVCVDCSSSMNWGMGEDGRSRHANAMDALIGLQASYDGKLLLISFGLNGAEYRFNGMLPSPSGMTPMHLGLEKALPFDGLMDVILISDGEPDNESAALSMAGKFADPIHTIFIGDKGDPGELFMAKISGLKGGTHGSGFSKAFEHLKKQVTFLLEAHT
jgi:hypothetical protein